MSEKKEEKKVEKKEVKSTFKFYKNELQPGLRFMVEPAEFDPTKIKYVGFFVKKRNVNGYYAPVGLLKTDNVKVIELVKAYPFIVEIEEKEYKKLLKG